MQIFLGNTRNKKISSFYTEDVSMKIHFFSFAALTLHTEVSNRNVSVEFSVRFRT